MFKEKYFIIFLLFEFDLKYIILATMPELY